MTSEINNLVSVANHKGKQILPWKDKIWTVHITNAVSPIEIWARLADKSTQVSVDFVKSFVFCKILRLLSLESV